MSKEVILETLDLWKVFGRVEALKGVNLKVYKGELLVLLGPSGSGKSTLLRIIAGLEVPTRGKVIMEGNDITNTPPYKRDTSMIFQHLALFPHMTVYDNVAYGLKIRGLPKDEIDRRVDEVLELVKIKELKDRRVTQLSGGQQQRVAIARSLILHPKILLLDEPLGALDLKLRKELHIELRRLHQEVGNTWIFVTHDQEEALTLADRIGIMNEGRLIQIGDKWDVYEMPKTKFVAEFIGETNIFECEVIEKTGDKAIGRWMSLEILISRAEDLTPGEKIFLSVRPEYIGISKEKPNNTDINIFHGSIIDEVFRGSYVIYHIRLDNGETIKVTVLSKDAEYDPGDKVYIYWKYDKGVPLKN